MRVTSPFKTELFRRSISFGLLSTCWFKLARAKLLAVLLLTAVILGFFYKWNTGRLRQQTSSSVPGTLMSLYPRLLLQTMPEVRVDDVDCAALVSGDKTELKRAITSLQNHTKLALTPQNYIKMSQFCWDFVHKRGYFTVPVSKEEAAFPIAFSILLYKDVEQFERLLRAIYRPQNWYCVHVDKKSPRVLHDAVQSIVSCFNNVFVSPKTHKVEWGMFSVLQPELSCMQALLTRKKRWKYFINLTGQEFPLKTNWQLVRILKAFNESNNMEGTIKRGNKERFIHSPPPPYNVTLVKGSVHIAATRKFVQFVVNGTAAQALLKWVQQTQFPDETFFATLNHNPQLGTPGAYLGEPETDVNNYPFLVRFKNWGNGPFNWPCNGKRVSLVCVFGVGDVPLLATRRELFANKFHADYQYVAYDCMEQLHYNRTRNELLLDLRAADVANNFNANLYSSFGFVRNHI